MLAAAGAARGGHALLLGESNKVPSPVAVTRGGRAFAVGTGEREGLVSGNVQEGVKEEVSVALAQGGRLDQHGHPDGLLGA